MLQETLKSSLEASVIPAFEMSCRSMFEQVDATFQKGMGEHATAALQQFDSSHSPLALALRVWSLSMSVHHMFCPITKLSCQQDLSD